jgi:hypothetical protein
VAVMIFVMQTNPAAHLNDGVGRESTVTPYSILKLSAQHFVLSYIYYSQIAAKEKYYFGINPIK